MAMIEKPGVYDLTADEYHADPCVEPSLSSSIAKALVGETPLHAWQDHPRLNPEPAEGDEDEGKFDIGKACHSLVLGDTQAFEIIAAKSWSTKAAQDGRKAARAAGKIPLLEKQWLRVQAMAHSLKIQLARHQDASDAFTNGKPEQTLVWREGDAWCRCRLDWLPNVVSLGGGLARRGKFFDDYKSTTCADPDAWSRRLFELGFDMQDAFYRRGIRALGLCDDPTFRFIVQEVKAPHAMCSVALMPGALDLAEHKVARAIDIWTTCLRTGQWPGYPLRTCYVDVPPWHEAAFIARDSRAYDSERDAKAADQFHRPLEDA